MNKLKLINPMIMWLMVLSGVAIIFNLVSAQKIFAENTLSYLLFISAIFYWLYFVLKAAFINRQLTASVDKTKGIIKEGVYGLVRHPIYTADIILDWGVFFFWPTLRVLTSVLWLTLVLLFWIRLEEWGLTQRFGDEYQDYQKRVPMIIPKIFKK